DITSDDVLASCYRNATVSVIPSLKEPFGMVTTESLASGTPVVGTRSGATPEILDDPGVGVLFEPTDGPDELCKTLLKGLELAQDPQTSKRCSQHAQKYAWSTLGPQYEELYHEILNNKSRRSYRRPRHPTEEKIISLGMSDQSVQFRSQAGKRSLNQFFVDTLDDLDITYDAYYKIDSYRPRCLYILNWIIATGINKGNVLVLSTYPHFLTILLEKLGFKVREIAINQWLKTGEEADGYKIFSSPQMPAGLEESFDVIVCDDLLQYLVSPVKVLQVLKKWLIPKGLFILTTPNATRGSLRLRLLIENIYSKLEDSLANGGSPRKDNYHAMCHREYALREVEEILSRAEFEPIHKKCFIGKKFIYNRISFSPMTVKTYLLKKIYNQFQKIIIPLRSHLFVAGRNSLPADGNDREMMSQ
ncbi:MAG: glycosyltransferase, partial [Candidatus Hodarchaeota archaeon]